MERRISSLKIILFFALILSSALLFAQTPDLVRNIRIPLWAELDAYPELKEAGKAGDADSGQYDFPIKSIRELAPFIISGMVYGWEFYYTPKDKIRGVDEHLEIKEIVDSSGLKSGISYVSPWIQNNRLNTWCEYRRNDSQVQNYNLWSSIQNPVIHGRGYGELSKGFDGIRDAAYDALKEAIRSHYRNTIKNKPKAITGSVLIRDIPTIGIDSGRYVFNLDFFLEYGKIVEYKVY